MSDVDYLEIYLRDHMAGASAGHALAKRIRDRSRGTPSGEAMAEVAEQIGADKKTLGKLMSSFEIEQRRLKQLAAWSFEKLARLKPNGRLRGPTPLGQLFDLEMLALGITGKISLWQNLRAADLQMPAGVDLDGLIERGRAQRSVVERLRHEAAIAALGPSGRAATAGR